MVSLLKPLGESAGLARGRPVVDGLARRAHRFGLAHAPYLSRVTATLRAPLRPAVIEQARAAVGLAWPAPILLASIGSTNAEALALARGGAPEGTCVVAEEQTAGRGRHRRSWVSPPGAGLWASVILDLTDLPNARWGLVPLAAGLAVADAIARTTGLEPALKWPNDVLVASAGAAGKLAGILVEAAAQTGPAAQVVVGMGLNVDLDERPPGASCLASAGYPPPSREVLLVAELNALHERMSQLRDDPPDLLREVRERCATLGRSVRVVLPGDQVLEGQAVGIADDGSLEVQDGQGMRRFVTAGDVIHATI